MKKVLHLSISVLLSVFILVSGSGLIIGKMVCLKSGYVVVDTKEAKDCCGNESSLGTSIKGVCCDISNVAFHQNNFIGENNFSLKSPLVVELHLIPEATQTSFPLSSLHKEEVVYRAPPLDSRVTSALPFLGAFRI